MWTALEAQGIAKSSQAWLKRLCIEFGLPRKPDFRWKGGRNHRLGDVFVFYPREGYSNVHVIRGYDTAADEYPSHFNLFSDEGGTYNSGKQLAVLSEERLAFGNVPLYSASRQVFFISNSSSDHAVSFRWMLEGTPADQVVFIEPDHGYLHPGQSTLLKISFFSCGAPSMYDMDILCEIVDETEMAMFNERLIKWTNEQEERQYTFTITEADVTIPWSGPRLRSLDSSNTPHSKSESDLRRYQALPPIGCQEPTNTSKQRRKSGTPPQPSPPESFWLHLGVTARTHMIAEFHRSFPENTNEFIIDQRYVVNHEENKETGDLSALVSCTNSEMNVITDVMSVILRGLLEDSNFHGSLGELDNEPVPYFRQLGETPYIYDRTPSRASSSSSSRSEPGHEYPDEPDLAESRAQESSYQVSYHDDRASSRTHEIVQRSSSVLSAVDHLRDESLDPEWKASQRNKARSLPEFTSLLESVIENSLLNIMTEANYGELSLTARPRVIALPPSRLAKR